MEVWSCDVLTSHHTCYSAHSSSSRHRQVLFNIQVHFRKGKNIIKDMFSIRDKNCSCSFKPKLCLTVCWETSTKPWYGHWHWGHPSLRCCFQSDCMICCIIDISCAMAHSVASVKASSWSAMLHYWKVAHGPQLVALHWKSIHMAHKGMHHS